jgi:hypothetical protein
MEPGVGRDRISGLPDELLHAILRHLRSAPAAARTSAISHRWRRVWAHAPDLVFGDDLSSRGVPPFLDAVDAALASYSDDRTTHVDSLEITVPYICGETVPSTRVASWLRFATQRRAGAFFLSVPDQPVPWPQVNVEDDELELPPCEGTTKVYLNLGSMFFLRIPPAGMFGALADLEISGTTMDGQELGVILSSHCPRLQNLSLFVKLVDACDISVRSASLSVRCHTVVIAGVPDEAFRLGQPFATSAPQCAIHLSFISFLSRFMSLNGSIYAGLLNYG